VTPPEAARASTPSGAEAHFRALESLYAAAPINRLFEFAARHETVENLSSLRQIPSAQRSPRVAG